MRNGRAEVPRRTDEGIAGTLSREEESRSYYFRVVARHKSALDGKCARENYEKA